MKKLMLVLLLGMFMISLGSAIGSVTWENQTAGDTYPGFSPVSAGMGSTSGICANATDIYIVEDAEDRLYHFNYAGANLTGSINLATIGADNARGCGMNETDIWVVDVTDDFAYHLKADGTNQTDGFSTALLGSGTPRSITTDGTQFWIADSGDNAIYNANGDGTNSTGGFALGVANTVTGVSYTDFGLWISSDAGGGFVYHYINGVNQTDGFSSKVDGTANPYDIGGTNTNLFLIDANQFFVYHYLLNSTLDFVTLNSPNNGNTTILQNITFNCSAESVLSTIQNVSLYTNIGGTFVKNQTIDYSASPPVSANQTFTINNIPYGTYLWNCLLTTTSNSRYWATNNTLKIGHFIVNSQTYNATTYQSNNETFILNITTDGTIPTNGKFIYNGVDYGYGVMNTYSTTDYTFTKAILIPTVSGNVSFYWNITFSGSETDTSTPTNQTVLALGGISITNSTCAAGFNRTMYFSFQDEITLINVTMANASYNIQYGYAGNTSAFVLSGSVLNVNNFSICINNSDPYYSIGYGEVDYSIPSDVDRKYYIFQNTRLTNVTITNVLYGLATTLATSFQYTAQQITLEPYVDYYIGLLRWYPSLNEYKVVDMGKTDENGQTVLRVKTEDTDYRYAIYQPDGTLIKLFNSVRMICQTNPCTYSLIVNPSPLSLTDYTNIQSSLTFNETTNIFTFIWNDPSQQQQTMNLTVWHDGSTFSEVVCSSVATSYTGVLTCDATGSTGTLRAVVYRTASPLVTFRALQIIIGSTFISAGGGIIGLFIASILLICLALMGLVNPILVIIFSILALLPAFFMGNITFVAFGAIIVIGAIIIHFIRRSV